MAAKGQNFEIFAGDTHRVVITVTDGDGLIFNLTGYTAKWNIFHPTTKSIVIQKTTASGITIPTPSNGEILVDLLPEDTVNILPRTYNHECQIQSVDDIQTVCIGTITVLYSNVT